VIYISIQEYSQDTLEEYVFETDVEDYLVEDGMFKIFTSIENFNKVSDFFTSKNISFEHSEINFLPTTQSNIDEFDKALKLVKMLEAFEEDEDVENITTNMIIEDDLLEKVKDFIEKNSFKT
jgi:transcriptional/translational regulatory protein YebC/TACO1